jgi:hypothetical protein
MSEAEWRASLEECYRGVFSDVDRQLENMCIMGRCLLNAEEHLGSDSLKLMLDSLYIPPENACSFKRMYIRSAKQHMEEAHPQ